MDESTKELVRDWLTRASHDLRSSHALAALEDPLLDTAIYHCQQAAEKAVKAWLLVGRGQWMTLSDSTAATFPKENNISILLTEFIFAVGFFFSALMFRGSGLKSF